MKTTAYLSLITASFFTFSCASPLPIAKLEVVNPESTYWQQGMEIVTLTNDSLEVELGFVRKENAHYLFDVTITNYRSTPVLIDPSAFYYIPIHQNDTLKLVRAENPESRILDKEMELSRLEAKEYNKALSGVIFGSVELANEVAKVGSDTPQEENEYSILDQTNADLIEIEQQKNSTINQLSYWETKTLRKTTLFSNHYVQGQILMIWTQEANQIWVLIPVDNQEFEFRYNQILHSSYHRPTQ